MLINKVVSTVDATYDASDYHLPRVQLEIVRYNLYRYANIIFLVNRPKLTHIFFTVGMRFDH